jgi:hypothetical protein
MYVMFDFKILFAIIFIIISDEIFQLSHVIFIIQFLSTKIQNVNPFFSQIHVRVAYLFLLLLVLNMLVRHSGNSLFLILYINNALLSFLLSSNGCHPKFF